MGNSPNQKRLKICIVGPSKRFLSGISYHTIMLANALSKKHDVSVVLFRKMVPGFIFPGRERIGKNLSKVSFTEDVKVFDGVDYASLRSWISAAKFVKKIQPDIVILQWWTTAVAHMELALKILFTAGGVHSFIIEMHEIIDTREEKSSYLHFYSTITMRSLKVNTKAFITHSHSDIRAITTRYKIRENLIHVIPLLPFDQYHKIDREKAIKKLNLNPKHFIILYFGLIRPYKGLRYLIEAFNQLPANIANNCCLLIVGEIWGGREEIIRAIKTSRYNDKIISRFEYVPDDAVSQFFSACDVLVLPYLRASQSAVAHIGINFGKQMIISRVGGLEESMSNYEGTIFVTPKNANAIKESIIKVYNNKKNVKFESPVNNWGDIVKMYNELFCSITLNRETGCENR